VNRGKTQFRHLALNGDAAADIADTKCTSENEECEEICEKRIDSQLQQHYFGYGTLLPPPQQP